MEHFDFILMPHQLRAFLHKEECRWSKRRVSGKGWKGVILYFYPDPKLWCPNPSEEMFGYILLLSEKDKEAFLAEREAEKKEQQKERSKKAAEEATRLIQALEAEEASIKNIEYMEYFLKGGYILPGGIVAKRPANRTDQGRIKLVVEQYERGIEKIVALKKRIEKLIAQI